MKDPNSRRFKDRVAVCALTLSWIEGKGDGTPLNGGESEDKKVRPH